MKKHLMRSLATLVALVMVVSLCPPTTAFATYPDPYSATAGATGMFILNELSGIADFNDQVDYSPYVYGYTRPQDGQGHLAQLGSLTPGDMTYLLTGDESDVPSYIPNGNSDPVLFRAEDNGTYTFILIVGGYSNYTGEYALLSRRTITVEVTGGNSAPVATDVQATGTAQVGKTLTASYTYTDAEGDAQATAAYQWYWSSVSSGASNTAISGATGSTYVVGAAYEGKYIAVAVTPKASAGISPGSIVFSPFVGPVSPANLAPSATNVQVTGTAQVGQTLTGHYTYTDEEDDLEGTSTYRWYRADNAAGLNKAAISSATAITYVLQTADVGKCLSFEVTPVAATGTSPGTAVESARTSAVVPAEAAPAASSVQVTGTAQVGQTLTGHYTYSDVNGDLEGSSTYRWYRADNAAGLNKAAISGATAITYVVQAADLGKCLSFEVTPVATTGTSTGTAVESTRTSAVVVAEAAPVASGVQVTGTAQVGQTLTGHYTYSDVNGDVEGSSTYRWYRADNAAGLNKAAISGATAITYVVQAADLGKYLSFEVTPVAATGTSPGTAVESARTSAVVPAEAAPVASGVQVTGTAQVGQTLTGHYTYSDVNGDLEGSSTYRWYRADNASGLNKAAIAGETATTYVVQAADVGKCLSFEVTPVAATGTSTGTAVESARTSAVVPAEAAPVASSVQVTGTAQVGQTLTGHYVFSDVNGDLEGSSTYRWYRADNAAGLNKAAISGATAITYVVQAADLGKCLSFEVTPVAATGTSTGTAVESARTAAVVPAEAAPVASGVSINISGGGSAQVGAHLEALYSYSDVNGDLEFGSTFRWYRADNAAGLNKTVISGETFAVYDLRPSDVGKYIFLEVMPAAQTGMSPGLVVESSPVGPVIPAEAPPVASNVQVSGLAQVGQTLTGSYTYSDVNGDVESGSDYQWYRADNDSGLNKAAISGAGATTYVVQAADIGKHLSFEVTPVAATGISTGLPVESAPVGAVVLAEAAPVASSVQVTGTAQVGQTLTGHYIYSDVNGDLEGSSTYRWYRADNAAGLNKAAISGATAITYVLQAADLGKYLSFGVTPVAATGIASGTAVESARTAAVVPAEAAPVATSVQVTGTAQVGQTLTGHYTYTDVNGDLEGTSTYRWYRADNAAGLNKAAISGANATTYVVQAADLGKYLSFGVAPVAATGIAAGTEVESARTATVVPAEAPPVASDVQVSGVAQVGRTLAGDYTYSDVNNDAEGSSAYQWYRSNDASGTGKTAIAGANQLTYKLQMADYGKHISFTVQPAAETGMSPGSLVESDLTAAVKLVVTVTYDAGSGTVTPATQEKLVGATYGKGADGATEEAMPTPAYTGYTFAGWWTDVDSGTQVTDATEVSTLTNHTLHAKWTRKNYTVNYVAGDHGSVGGPGSETVLYGDSPAAVPEATADAGYAFAGWSKDGGTTKLTKTQVEALVITEPVTLTAYFVQLTYTVDGIANQTMAEIAEGYTAGTQETKTITLTKTGTGDLQNLSVALSGEQAGSFLVSQPVATALTAAAPSTAFTVKAKAGLAKGTYTATVTVKADRMADVSFTVTQVVTAAAAGLRDVTIYVTDGQAVISGVSITVNGTSKTTKSSGKAVFSLADGSYGIQAAKGGYASASGNVTVSKNSTTYCLVMAKEGQTVLYDDDESTDGVVIADEDVLPGNVILVVDEKTAGAEDEDAVGEHYEDYHIATLFDIYLLLGEDFVQPDGSVTVGIPVPAGLQGRSLLVVRINDDGSVTEFETTQTGNLLFFTTDHFSRYAILADNEVNPDTGEAATGMPVGPIAGALAALLVAAGVGQLLWNRRRRLG